MALVGCGHMGTHHARIIANHPGSRLVAAVDLDRGRAERVAERWGCAVEDRVPRAVDAVVVATPTTTHVRVAAPLLARGQWCLVEKPLAEDAEAAAILDDPRAVVGHVERFNPAVRAAGPLRPRFVEARRCAPPSARAADVDVVVDLMIHDLDLLLHWCDGEPSVEVVDAVGVRLVGPESSAGGRGEGMDLASVRVRTACGISASLFASRVASAPRRRVTVYEDGRCTDLDLLAGEARRGGEALAWVDGADGLTAQWAAFLAQVAAGEPPRLPAGPRPARPACARRALELAGRVQEALRASER